MNLTPEMNAHIVGILRTGHGPHCLYAALRIEKLEDVQKAAVEVVRQTSSSAAYLRHDALIAALEAAEAEVTT